MSNFVREPEHPHDTLNSVAFVEICTSVPSPEKSPGKFHCVVRCVSGGRALSPC